MEEAKKKLAEKKGVFQKQGAAADTIINPSTGKVMKRKVVPKKKVID